MPSLEEDKPDSKSCKEIDACLTEEERKRLLANLHHALVWVGEKEPMECRIDGAALNLEMELHHQTEKDLPPEVHADSGTVELHSLIWRLINEKEITKQERMQIEELIDLLKRKEQQEEDSLRDDVLTATQAKKLYSETAGVIRSLLDLKDLLKRGDHTRETLDRMQRKVDDARRWNDFLDEVKKGKA